MVTRLEGAAVNNPSDYRAPIVYLAGGFHSGWQDKVMEGCPHAEYRDPRKHCISDPKEYTEWDLAAIRESTIIFAYLESTNPGGYSLALEMGFAKALGKRIILVDQKSQQDSNVRGYLAMIRAISHEVHGELYAGIEALCRAIEEIQHSNIHGMNS